MDVFLVPVGASRYELYCEVPDDSQTDLADDGAEAPGGGRVRRFFRRMKERFNQMVAEAERERRHGPTDGEQRGWLGRLHRRLMRWVAESIAEQRLLWTLRKSTAATLHFPADLPEDDAIQRLRKQLGRDFDKHQFWLVIDSLAFIASGLLMIIPGPNLVAYYFAFRMVGHFLSLRGARQGLSGVSWTHAPSGPLAELRPLVDPDAPARDARVQAIASALGLEHLPRFFTRTATAA